MQHFVRPGVTTSYRVLEGAGDGVPLLIVPGLAADPGEWGRCARTAATRGPVIVAGVRGQFGEDAGPHPERTTLADLTSDVVALLDDLGIERAHLLGHSMGGVVALDLALRRPERVGALVLVSTTPEASSSRERERAVALVSESVIVPMTEIAGGTAGVSAHPAGENGGSSAPSGWDDPARHRRAAALALATREAQTPFLGQIGAPTLVVVGERDLPALQRGAELLHGWIPNSRLVRVPNAAHHPHRDAPEPFMELVLAFLREVDASV